MSNYDSITSVEPLFLAIIIALCFSVIIIVDCDTKPIFVESLKKSLTELFGCHQSKIIVEGKR